jgi:hypothetical protein
VRKWHLEKEGLKERCTKQPAQIAGKSAKYHSNQKKADLFIAGNATQNIEDTRKSKRFSVSLWDFN